MIDGIGKSITDFKSIVMIVPFGSRVFARLRSITDSISFTSSESNGTTALLYGYFPSTFDASINKPWEHVKMVNVAATASFRMPEILATTAILLWFSPRCCCCRKVDGIAFVFLSLSHLSFGRRRREEEDPLFL